MGFWKYVRYGVPPVWIRWYITNEFILLEAGLVGVSGYVKWRVIIDANRYRMLSLTKGLVIGSEMLCSMIDQLDRDIHEDFPDGVSVISIEKKCD